MSQNLELELIGLEGSNPLAFLAALGTLRAMGLAWPERCFRLSWRLMGGVWRPVLLGAGPDEAEALLERLDAGLKGMRDLPALSFAQDLSVDTETFRAQAERARTASSVKDRRNADFIAAFGCEAMPRAERSQEKIIQDTALRTMSGTGNQHFLGFMRVLVEETGPDHLASALFQEWRYADPGPSMRWDPHDDRRYALRWGNPGNSSRYPIATVRGANRLAIEGLPLLPTAPVGRRLETTGFRQQRGEGAVWTWPIWTVPLGVDPLRSLLSLPDLQEKAPDRRRLLARGVAEVFRCQRLTIGKYRNFSTAHPV